MRKLKYLSFGVYMVTLLLGAAAHAADNKVTQVIGPIAPDQMKNYCVLDSKAFSPGFQFCYNDAMQLDCSAPLASVSDPKDNWKTKQAFWEYAGVPSCKGAFQP